MKKSYLWRKMTSGLMAAAVTVTAMPGLGLTMVQAEEKKTLKVAMEMQLCTIQLDTAG